MKIIQNMKKYLRDRKKNIFLQSETNHGSLARFVEDLEPCVAKKMMICGSLEHYIQVPDEKFMVSNCSTCNISAVGVSLMMVWRFLGGHTAYTPVAKLQKK